MTATSRRSAALDATPPAVDVERAYDEGHRDGRDCGRYDDDRGYCEHSGEKYARLGDTR
jgi:hypothetical protein